MCPKRGGGHTAAVVMAQQHVQTVDGHSVELGQSVTPVALSRENCGH